MAKAFFVNWLLSQVEAQIAQSVEQRTENPCVAGSIPALGTYNMWNFGGSVRMNLAPFYHMRK